MSALTRRELLLSGTVGLGVAALASPVPAAVVTAAERAFHYDHICGTSLDVWFTADRDTDAEARVLAEVDRLTAVFSLYDPDSELSRLNRSFGTVAVSADLLAVLAHYQEWQTRTAGACNPRVSVFVNMWAYAELTQQLPDAGFLVHLARFIARPDYTLDEARGTATRTAVSSLDLNAIAKGYIVGRLADLLKSIPGVSAGLVNLGGDMAAFGEAYTVGVQDPFAPAENATPLGTFALCDAAVATSGGYQRFHTIHGQRYSHLIDPRTGWPATAVASATVIAPTSVTANALATTLGVMGIDEGLRLVSTVAGAECLIVGPDGKQFRSPGFPLRLIAVNADAPKGAWPDGFQVSVALELPAVNAAKYRRPYVAVWFEDADGKAVRTLTVWGNSPKYTKDLSDWWKFAKEDKALVKATTRATRGPGKYELVWDGKDDGGKAVPAGIYTVRVEVHREHGKHLRQSGKIECGAEKAELKLPKNDETGQTVLTYGAMK